LLEGEIRYNNHQIELWQNHIIRYFLADTLDEEKTNVNIDSVIAYLGTDVESKMILISALEEKGEMEDAVALNDEIRGTGEEFKNFCTMHDIIIDLIQNEQTPYIMRENSSLHEEVEEIAEDTTLIGYEMARAVLSMVFGNQYPVWIEQIDTSRESPRLENSINYNGNKTDTHSLNLYPNPSNGSVTVEAIIPDDSRQGEIVIFNLLGERNKTYNLENGKNILHINIADYLPGIYLCMTKDKSGIIDKRKLIILNSR
jgi:hypothetical protein